MFTSALITKFGGSYYFQINDLEKATHHSAYGELSHV